MSDDSRAASNAPYRWTIDEYILRCELNNVEELIVEGDSDHCFFLDLLSRYSLPSVTVIDADCFHVPGAEVLAAGHNDGAKGRLLTLASAICRAIQERPLSATVMVVVDRDYDGDVPDRAACAAVATDGHSVENYAPSEAALQRFLRGVLGRHEPP